MKTRRAYDASEHTQHAKSAPLDGLFAANYQPTISPTQTDSKAARVLQSFESRRPTNASLAYVRGKLVDCYNDRVRTAPAAMHFVTSDDAARILDEWSEFPRGGSQNWKGAVFRTSAWERIPGDVPSLRPSHNGTPLARWRPR